jgi:hypothetical protein
MTTSLSRRINGKGSVAGRRRRRRRREEQEQEEEEEQEEGGGRRRRGKGMWHLGISS